MRHCVLRHHVCLCVLSTAMLAGLALLTEQKKGYAALMNYCQETASGRGERIECNEGGTKTLRGDRTIDMGRPGNKNQPAVMVYKKGGRGVVDIMITSSVTITGSDENTHPAIVVNQQGVLTVMNVIATGVKKGIEVKDSGSSVTVNRGKITIRSGGDSVIEVKGGGKVTLNDEVTVTGGGDSTGIVVGGTGGNVTLMTKNFTGVNKGIVFKGTGMANATVSGGAGGGTTMTVEGSNGVGIMMEGTATGTANASVMNMTVKGQNSGTGVDMKNGTLELNKVGVSNFTTGAQVSDGMLTVMGGEINGKSTGVDMTGGVLTVTGKSRIVGSTMGVNMTVAGSLTVSGSTIQVTNGTGLRVEGMGTANVTGGKIMATGIGGSGSGRVGVEVNTSGRNGVTLTSVDVSGFTTGAIVQSGKLTVMGGAKIMGKSMGVEVKGGKFVAVMSGEGKIEVTTGTGLKVMGGSASVMGGEIKASGGAGITGNIGVEVNTSGREGVTLSGVTVSNFATGAKVSNGKLTVMGESKIMGSTMGVEVKENGEFEMGGSSGIQVEGGTGVGLKVERDGTANVMNTMIMASGRSGGKTGVESSGTVTLNMVGVMGFDKGVSVSDGKLTVNGGSIIQGKSVGVEVKENGEFEMGGSSGIQVEGGTGLKVTEQGTANVMNTMITASGSGIGQGTGVLMEGSKTVTLMNVGIEKFEKGISMTKGEVTVKGKSVIEGKSVGVEVTGGKFMMGGEESAIVVEKSGVGLKVEGMGSASVTNTTITTSGGGGTGVTGKTGVEVSTLGKNGVTLTDVKIEKFETGISVTKGTFKMTRGSIKGENKGYGVYATSGTVTLDGEVKISQVETGVYMESGELTMTGGGQRLN